MALEAAPGPSASASTGDADELSDAHGDQPVPLDAGMNPVEVPGPRAGKQMALVGRRDEQEALDRLIERLIEEGYITVSEGPPDQRQETGLASGAGNTGKPGERFQVIRLVTVT